MLEMGAGRAAMNLHWPDAASYRSAVCVSVCPLLPATAYTLSPLEATACRPRRANMGGMSCHALAAGS